jgi:hypothetical protein
MDLVLASSLGLRPIKVCGSKAAGWTPSRGQCRTYGLLIITAKDTAQHGGVNYLPHDQSIAVWQSPADEGILFQLSRDNHLAYVGRRRDDAVTGTRQEGVRCGNLVTPPDRTREQHHRDGRGAQHEHQRLATPWQPAVVAPVARATALDEGGDHCSDRRMPHRPAQGVAGSVSVAGRGTLNGRCARTARQRHWLVVRETACERSQSSRLEIPRQRVGEFLIPITN